MIELDLSQEQATLIWCRMIRARKIAKEGLATGNIALLAEGFAWYDEALDTISRSVVGGLRLGPNGLPINPETGEEIDGSETPKP